MYNILELLLLIPIMFVIIDLMDSLTRNKEIKFKNAILDLDTDKEYSLDDIKSIFAHINTLSTDITNLNEYNVQKIHKYIDDIRGNLLKSNTQYYYHGIILKQMKNIFYKNNNYSNNKTKLLIILSKILQDIKNDKEFFGLNKREKELFSSLMRNTTISQKNLKIISELKDIIINRYAELLAKDDKSDKLAKISIKLAYISVILTVCATLYTIYYSNI